MGRPGFTIQSASSPPNPSRRQRQRRRRDRQTFGCALQTILGVAELWLCTCSQAEILTVATTNKTKREAWQTRLTW